MSKWKYEYDTGIPDEDKNVLEAKKNAFLSAFMCQSIFWQLHRDTQNRCHYRAVRYSNRTQVLCQVAIDVIKTLADETLKNKIIAGHFEKQNIP